MDVWSDFLGYKSDFLSILRSLCGEDYDRLNNQIPKQEARFQDLLKLHYVKNLTDIDDIETLTPVDGFVLICIYAWISITTQG